MDDNTAIQRCKAGERGAYRHLVERYRDEAIGHAIAILRNRDDALDAVQDAFVDAYRALEGFDSARRFYPWFYVLLRNRCFKLTGHRKKRVEVPDDTAILEQVAQEESNADLEGALAELSPSDREILTLKYLDGCSYNDLAEHLSIPRGTVMSRLFHARRRLRDIMNR